ncbi:hypothetical protein, partial [Mycobacterium riyadhense]|uniref:hypothetical protein n=1 Tax=Mycobacterium riyadhense TaxID=486698 RepID=UPI0021F2927B
MRHPSVGRVKRRRVVGWAATGKPGTGDASATIIVNPKPKAAQAISISLALNSMRRTAPPSRPYGRYAVGLRP